MMNNAFVAVVWRMRRLTKLFGSHAAQNRTQNRTYDHSGSAMDQKEELAMKEWESMSKGDGSGPLVNSRHRCMLGKFLRSTRAVLAKLHFTRNPA